MKDQLLVAASRIAKLIVTVLALWLLERWKIDMSPAMRALFEQLLAAGFVAGVLGLAAHFGVAIKANPLDAVSPTESRRGRQQKGARKALRATEERIAKAGAEPVPDSPDDLPPRDYIPAKERGDGL